MREDGKEAIDNSSFCLGHYVDGGAITDTGEYSFGLDVFVVSEGHSNGDVQLAVGYSSLGLRREVVGGDNGFGVDFWKWMKILFLVILLIVLGYSALLHTPVLPCNCGELCLQLLDPSKFLLSFLLCVLLPLPRILFLLFH